MSSRKQRTFFFVGSPRDQQTTFIVHRRVFLFDETCVMKDSITANAIFVYVIYRSVGLSFAAQSVHLFFLSLSRGKLFIQ